MRSSKGRDSFMMLGATGLAMLLLVACGQHSDTPSTSTAAAPQPVEPQGGDAGVCSMLSAEQVASVLPGSDGGSPSDGGGSLIEGVESRQCSYVASRDAELDLLTVIVTTAPDDALFEQIQVTGFAFDDEDAVPVGDRGWKKDDSADEFEVVANKGRSVVRMNLMAPGARDKAATMIAMAQVVAEQL